MGVMLPQDGLIQGHHLGVNDLVVLALDAGNNLPHQAALNTVGLQHNIGSFDSHVFLHSLYGCFCSTIIAENISVGYLFLPLSEGFCSLLPFYPILCIFQNPLSKKPK